VLAARGLLTVGTVDRRWLLTRAGEVAARAAAGRWLGDDELWRMAALCRRAGVINVDEVARRLGVTPARVETWCQRQRDADRLFITDGRWKPTDRGLEALSAASGVPA